MRRPDLTDNILYKTLFSCRRVFILIAMFGFTINVLNIFMSMYTMQVLDRVLSSQSMHTLVMLTLITIAAFVAIALLDACRSLTLAKVGEWMDQEVSPELIKKTMQLTLLKNTVTCSEILRDFGNIKTFMTGQAIFSLFDAPWTVIYLILLYMINPMVLVIAIIGLLWLITLAIWNEIATKSVSKQMTNEYLGNLRDVDFASRNAEILEAMGMTNRIVDMWLKRNQEVQKMQLKTSGRSTLIMSITKFSRMVLQISVIGCGAYFTIKGNKTMGGIIACSILMGRALAPFEQAIGTWRVLGAARISYRRLQSMLINVPDRHDHMQLPTPIGKLDIDRVFYSPYGSNLPILKGISANIRPGETVAIIGPSACGKSTFLKLLVGVWQANSGSVRLDGANVYTWNREDFGKHVGYLPQDVEIFNASVKDNISKMNPETSPEDVIEAAKIGGVHEMILNLPDGYDTKLGAGGVELSGGQKQRIGIARAFFGNVKVIILDEPNSNLDQEGEMRLMQAIMYAKKKKITTIFTTHKMQLLPVSDRVLVMQQGMVAAFEERDVILKKMQEQAQQAQTTTQQQRPLPPKIQPQQQQKMSISYSSNDDTSTAT